MAIRLPFPSHHALTAYWEFMDQLKTMRLMEGPYEPSYPDAYAEVILEVPLDRLKPKRAIYRGSQDMPIQMKYDLIKAFPLNYTGLSSLIGRKASGVDPQDPNQRYYGGTLTYTLNSDYRYADVDTFMVTHRKERGIRHTYYFDPHIKPADIGPRTVEFKTGG